MVEVIQYMTRGCIGANSYQVMAEARSRFDGRKFKGAMLSITAQYPHQVTDNNEIWDRTGSARRRIPFSPLPVKCLIKLFIQPMTQPITQEINYFPSGFWFCYNFCRKFSYIIQCHIFKLKLSLCSIIFAIHT